MRRVPLRALLLATAIAMLVPLLQPNRAAASIRATREEHVAAGVVRQINAFRAARGLSRLHVNDDLVAAARSHSLEMASLGYFSHDSADGASFWQRVRHWYPTTTIHWLTGENLVWQRPRISGARVVQLWRASPHHLANLVDPSWRDVGCSAVHSTAGPGVFAGRPMTVVTCDFGARS